MKEYIFVSYEVSGGDIDTTAIKIIATNEKDALIKAYSYFGGGRLEIGDFNTLCHNTPIERMYKIFKDFTNQTVQYFALANNEEFVSKLQEVDIIRCQ